MKIINNNRSIFLDSTDERSLKLILDYYLVEVSGDWGDQLNETSVITRIKDLISD